MVISLLRASYFYNSTGIRWYFLCLEPSSCICDRHHHGWVHALYWYYKKTVFRFVWYRLVFIQCSYDHEFICLWMVSLLCYWHHLVWVRYIHIKKITVACMSSLLLSIGLRRICYFIIFYFEVTNDSMEKWWMVK